MTTDEATPWPTYKRSLFHHETDADGVCHFSNYLRITEEALFTGLARVNHQPVADERLAITHVQCRFFRPLVFAEPFAVALEQAKVHRASAALAFEVRGMSSELKARVEITLVAVRREGHEVVPLSNAVRAALAGVASRPVAPVIHP